MLYICSSRHPGFQVQISLFSVLLVRKIYMPSGLISEEQLDQLSAHTTTFLATVRREVPSRKLGNITTNLHLFEGHAAQQIRHCGCRLGVLGEQGGEALHAALNELTRRHCAIHCPVKRLLTTTRQHHITTIPNIADKTAAKTTKNVPVKTFFND